RALLHRGRDRHAGHPDRDRRGIRTALGVHHHHGRLHGVRRRISMAAAALSGAAQAGPRAPSVTHFIPWEFPLLVIVPALAVDLLLQRTAGWRPLARAATAGVVFLAVFAAVQWPFANFLMTPAARNWFFGTAYFDYGTPARSAYARYVFAPRDATALQFWRGMAIAAAISCVMMWIGLHVGRAMRRVRR